MSRFPVAFRPPAFASRSSDSRRGIGPSLRSAYRARGPDPDGVTTFHTHELRPGWSPLYPEDGGAHPGWDIPSPGTCRFSATSPYTLLQHPTLRGSYLRGINRGSRYSPVRSSPRLWPPDGTASPRAFPRASHPAGRTGRRTSGKGQANEHGPGTTHSTSAEPPICVVHSMRATSCRTSRVGRPRRLREQNDAVPRHLRNPPQLALRRSGLGGAASHLDGLALCGSVPRRAAT